MARPITLYAPIHDPRKELIEKLETASTDHVEAVLEAYDLLQQLHDRGIFAALNGALGAGDKLANAATGAVDSPEAIVGLRNLVVLGKAFASIDPSLMHALTGAVDETVARVKTADDPPSLLSLLGQFRGKEQRRSLVLLSKFLGSFGRRLGALQVESKR